MTLRGMCMVGQGSGLRLGPDNYNLRNGRKGGGGNFCKLLNGVGK
jgi:hypothetical protein